MDLASIYYLGVTLVLFLVFAWIVVKTMNRKRKDHGENPKFRMMDDN